MEIVTFHMNKAFETSVILCNYHMLMRQIFNRQNDLSCRKRPPELNIFGWSHTGGSTVLFLIVIKKKKENLKNKVQRLRKSKV